MANSSQPEVMTAQELAEWLRVVESTVTRLAKQGKIPGARKVGYLWRFDRAVIERWFASVSSPAEEETQ